MSFIRALLKLHLRSSKATPSADKDASSKAFESCTEDQRIEYSRISGAAMQIALNAWNEHVSSYYNYYDDSLGRYITTYIPTQRYTNFFGQHGDPNLNPKDPDDEFNYHIIRDEIPRIALTQKITCQCDLEVDGVDPVSAYGWIHPDYLYQINFCPKSWQSPDLPSVYDEKSKIGVILHEISHFSDSYGGGTVDDYIEETGSYSESLRIGATDRNRAVRRPQSYVFYWLNLNLD